MLCVMCVIRPSGMSFGVNFLFSLPTKATTLPPTGKSTGAKTGPDFLPPRQHAAPPSTKFNVAKGGKVPGVSCHHHSLSLPCYPGILSLSPYPGILSLSLLIPEFSLSLSLSRKSVFSLSQCVCERWRQREGAERKRETDHTPLTSHLTPLTHRHSITHHPQRRKNEALRPLESVTYYVGGSR